MKLIAISQLVKELATLEPVLLTAIKKLAEAVQQESNTTGTPRAFLVGGIVRDLLLGRTDGRDADMEIYGVPGERLRALLEALFPDNVSETGATFGVLKVSLDKGYELDVAIPRRESKKGKGHRGFAIEGDPTMTIEDAARRRDFTMNALLLDPLTCALMDPFNGQEDIAAGVLRVVDPKTFQEDPLRVYRALQFAGRFDLTVELRTRELMREMVARGDLAELPAERITEEMRKLLLNAPTPSTGFNLARELGLIQRDYPELHALIDTPQELEWHPEGDVWTHTLLVVDQAAHIIRSEEWNIAEEEKIKVMIGALCHDLGKPGVTRLMDGRIRSHGHEEAGGDIAVLLCNRWTFGEAVDQAAYAVAREHLKPAMYLKSYLKGELNDETYANAVRRLLKRISPLHWRTFLAACEADYRGSALPGTDKGPFEPGIRFANAIRDHKLDEAAKMPLIQGRDLLEIGMQPGPEMGRIIAEIEALRDQGEIKTREEALAHIPHLND